MTAARIDRRSTRRGAIAALLVSLGVAHGALVGCATDDPGQPLAGDERSATTTLPPALRLLAGSPSPYAVGDDMWEVWICRVPNVVGHPVYADDSSRMERSVDQLVALLDAGVGEWFAARSHGRYRPRFGAGGEVIIAPADDGADCVDRAVARAGGGVEGVLVVADAAHRDDVSGGWGRPGVCGDPCVASTVGVSGRAVYVGGADFASAWGDRPPLDLVQHELGHTLDLPHSGDESTGERYTSPVDMMSDSAAPRAVQPDRRDAPDTLAVNRVALGWIPLDDVVVVTPTTQQVNLVASTAAQGDRVAVVALDEHRLVTLELLVPEGANDHLPSAGIAVHLIDQSPDACENPIGRLCTGQYRRQIPLVGDVVSHPGIPLLAVGGEIDLGPVVVRVLSIEGESAALAIDPT